MNRLCILPCAGLGSRMGMSFTQSKELLIDPATNEPLIQWHLNYCAKYKLTPLIITRKEKQDLIDFCNNKNIQTLIIEPKGEWGNTINASKHLWTDLNVVLFPDSKFLDDAFIQTAEKYLTDPSYEMNIIYGIQEVKDSSKWCVINEETDTLYEKLRTGPGDAVVIFCFNNNINKNMFKELNDNKTTHNPHWGGVMIQQYVDLTRTGKIEYVKI